MTNHRAPLAPGEIRTHVVGDRTFQVMHVMNGGMVQASYRDAGQPSIVLATKRSDHEGVGAYADAIEQAELDACDALDGDAEPIEPLTAEGEEALRVRSGFVPVPEGPYGALAAFADDAARQASVPAPTHADDVAALRAMIENGSACRPFSRTDALAILDRIAARAPQRATDLDQSPWYLHTCGAVALGDIEGPPDGCPSRECFLPVRWHPLYTLPDGV